MNYERVFRCTTAANGLVIRSEGMNIASDDRYTAWFGIEFPRAQNTRNRAYSINEVVCSGPKETEGEAVEAAAFKAIKRIVANGSVVVIDALLLALLVVVYACLLPLIFGSKSLASRMMVWHNQRSALLPVYSSCIVAVCNSTVGVVGVLCIVSVFHKD